MDVFINKALHNVMWCYQHTHTVSSSTPNVAFHRMQVTLVESKVHMMISILHRKMKKDFMVMNFFSTRLIIA